MCLWRQSKGILEGFPSWIAGESIVNVKKAVSKFVANS